MPAFLSLPNGSDALIVRSVDGVSWAGNGTASTSLNPDKLTLTTFVGSASDMDAVRVRPILKSSVILEPTGPRETCGVQDPRIAYNKADETYYMTYCVYGGLLPKDNKSNPRGNHCGDAGVGLATTKTPAVKESWVRRGYNCNNGTADNCGKSAAILVRESGPHYMFCAQHAAPLAPSPCARDKGSAFASASPEPRVLRCRRGMRRGHPHHRRQHIP